MPQASFVILEERGVLAVSGPDRTSFLQGLVSNDVGKLASDRALYAALLTAQGKDLHEFRRTEYGDATCLDGSARLADLVAPVDADCAPVTIEERPDLAVAVVFGADALDVLGLPADAGARRFGDEVVLVDRDFRPRRCAVYYRAGCRHWRLPV
jgi:glycine cleavage system aminomethyltransferase T